MPLEQYLIRVSTSENNFEIKASYDAGKFHKLQLSGEIQNKTFKNLGVFVPLNQVDIFDLKRKYPLVTYIKIDKATSTVWQLFTDAYFPFYKERSGGVKPRMDKEGKYLKLIIAYLTDNFSPNPDRKWQSLLDNWDNLDEFYRKQIDLKDINNNLAALIRMIDTPSGKDVAGYKSDWDRKYFSGLSPDDRTGYLNNLKSLGFTPKKEPNGKLIKWSKDV